MQGERPNEPERSPVERVLAIWGEVRAGEGTDALILFANVFLLLTAYYILKVVREALTIGGVQLFGLHGDEIKAYLPAVMMILLLGVVPAYGALASAVSRVRLINTTSILVMATLLGFWLWGSATGVGTAIGLTFYVYLGILNVFVIAQFWSFANDIYSEEQGKRLFAIIAIGQSLGAVLGPRIAAMGSDQVFNLPVVSAVIFGVCMLLYNVVGRRQEKEMASRAEVVHDEPLEKGGGFGLVLNDRYLLLIACMILVTNVVNTTGEYILSNAARTHALELIPSLDPSARPEVESRAREIVQDDPSIEFTAALDAARDEALRNARSAEIGRFYGRFFFWVNLVGVCVQMFLVSRILKYIGVRGALFALPLISFAGYTAIAVAGTLGVLRIAKTAENSIDYSLQNTVKQALFLPTSREAKYKAKAAIDTFFVRFGDAASAALIFVGLHQLSLSATDFAWLNVCLAGAWLLIVAMLAREHRKLSRGDDGESDFDRGLGGA